MPSKIDTELTPAQVAEMCEKLFHTPGGTSHLPTIQRIAREYGVDVSKMGASTFRDGTLADYTAQLKAKGERAQQIAEFAREGLSLSEAASIRLSETVFDALMSADAEGLTPEERDTYSKIIARARLGDARAAKLEADLRLRDEQIAKLTTEREAREASLRKAAEAAKEATSTPGASPEEVRAKALALVDEVMGIRRPQKQ